MNGRTKLHVFSWFQDCHHKKWGDCGSNVFQGYFDDAKESRVKQIPKNQASRIKSQRIKIQEQSRSRFKRRNREATVKTSQGKYFFKKSKHSTILFYKRVFSKFSKLLEYLLSGNRLPVSCNRLPLTKFDFKMFLTDLQCSKIFFQIV